MAKTTTLTEEDQKKQLLDEALKGMIEIETSDDRIKMLKKEEEKARRAAERATEKRLKAEADAADTEKNIKIIRTFAKIKRDTPDEKNKNALGFWDDYVKKFDTPDTDDITEKINYINDSDWLRTLLLAEIKIGNNGTMFYIDIKKIRDAVSEKYDDIKKTESETGEILKEKLLEYKKKLKKNADDANNGNDKDGKKK